MIFNNSYELVFGIYLAVASFFIAYAMIGSDKEIFMRNTSLNWILITFFIVIFFLFGYLFKNLILSFRDPKKRTENQYISTKEVPTVKAIRTE
jgi:hypothetical protein